MSGIFAGIMATIITLPVIGFLLFYIIFKWVMKNDRKSFLYSVDLSTLLLVLSVHFLIVSLTGKQYLWLIIMALISIFLGFLFLHLKYQKEIVLKKVFKGFWRFTFLLFLFTYLILFIVGLTNRIITMTA
ncbi:DUF3397 domain-containing protein [Bacillus timonensis]|nr:DUF3397 domain-containing protein [Bacillus timonensis]